MSPALRILISCCIICICLITPTVLRAHPHSFVSVKVDVQFDSDGQITGLRQHWLFDQLYTSYILADDLEDSLRSTKIPDYVIEEMTGNLHSLEDLGWFTRVERGEEPQALVGLSDFDWHMVADRMAVSFTSELKAPIDAASSSVRYAVYDPTYYISMTHGTWSKDQPPGNPILDDPIDVALQAADARNATRLIAAPDSCDHQISFSEPTEEMLLNAVLADNSRTTPGEYELGRDFAEWVTITCK